MQCTEAYIDNIKVVRVTDHLTNLIYVIYVVGVILAFMNAFHVMHILELDDALGVDMAWLGDPGCECSWIAPCWNACASCAISIILAQNH